MIEYTKPQLIQELSEGVKKIVFREVTTGEKSSDLITLKPQIIPPGEFRTFLRMSGRMESEPTTRIFAWDVVKGDWMSFYMETVDSLGEASTSGDFRPVAETDFASDYKGIIPRRLTEQ